MGKLPVVFCLLCAGFSATAQKAATLADTTRKYHFPANITITMADGQAKRVSEVQPGEPIRCVKAGRVTTDCIRKVASIQNTGTWLTALYLRPVDEVAVSRDTWPLVPALLLETAPTLTVSTTDGPRLVSQLKKGDILYHYEPETQQISAWKVGLVQRKARRVGTLYALVTEEGFLLPENMVALDR